jgi:SAM-dependent methyltransferase
MIQHRNNCRGCFSKRVSRILDFGRVPLAGGFILPEEIKKERKFPLKVYYCKDCGLVQILDVINPKFLFHKYFYLASVIGSLSEHFKEYAGFLKKNFLKSKEAKLLEIGSNDGVLLQYLRDRKAFGVDPSVNVSKIARKKGFQVWTDFFNRDSAKKILKKIGLVDVVTGSNVFAHADDIHEIMKAAKLILKPEGVFIVEVHYLKDLLDKFQYDTIYHEHLSYYSVKALKKIFVLGGFKIIDVFHLNMHGGGIRVIAANEKSIRKEKKSVAEFIKREKNINLEKLENFGRHAKEHKKQLVFMLVKIKQQRKTIVGYGAAGRGTTLLNYCQIGKKFLDYIVDESPLRSGKLMPGVHVPIFYPEVARNNPPDFFLLIAWNYAPSILKKERLLIKRGVKFILPFPKIRLIK